MTYNPNTPQPSEIPSESQSRFLTNFTLFNQYFGQDHISPGNVIANATNTAPIVITSPGYALSTGSTVTVYDIGGIEGNTPSSWPINGSTFTITAIDAQTFSLQGSDATTYPPYIPGTGNFSSSSYLYGYHTHLTAPNGLNGDPVPAAGGNLYSKYQIDPKTGTPRFTNPDLFFETGTVIDQLTRLFDNAHHSTSSGDQQQWAFVTPWGLIINIGFAPSSTLIVKLRKPYTTANYGVILGFANPARTSRFIVAVKPLGADPNMLTSFGLDENFPGSPVFGFSYYYFSMGV